MSSGAHEEVIRRYFEAAFSGDLAALTDVLAPNYVLHAPVTWAFSTDRQPAGRVRVEQFMARLHRAFPDGHATIDELITQGDKGVVRWVFRGTHGGSLMQETPTGHAITATGINIVRLEGGKIAEEWAGYDALGLLQQMGVIAPMPPTG